jgi:hypothetical protein
VAGDNPPKQPKEDSERREQAKRIAEISHRISGIGPQISAQISGLGHRLTSLIDQIQTDNKTTETREKKPTIVLFFGLK